MKKPAAIVITLAALAVATVPSEAGSRRVAVTAKAGTLGLGAELNLKLVPRVNARVIGQLFALDRDDTIGDVEYDVGVNLESFGALVDLHPFKGRFHLSAGVLSNGNEFETVARLTPAAVYTIGGTTFTGAELGDLRGIVEFDSMSPYFGIGWGNPFREGKGRVGFSIDLGVIDQGAPAVDLVASNPLGIPGLDQEVEAEELVLEDDLSNFEYYPVLSVGVSFRF